MKKTTKVLLFILLAPALGFICLFAYATLWDKYFNPLPPPVSSVTQENFAFENYGVHDHSLAGMKSVVDKLFPLGTPEDQVDAILVNKAGARKTWGEATPDNPSNGRYVAIYRHASVDFPLYRCPPDWELFFMYDENHRLRKADVLIGPRAPCL